MFACTAAFLSCECAFVNSLGPASSFKSWNHCIYPHSSRLALHLVQCSDFFALPHSNYEQRQGLEIIVQTFGEVLTIVCSDRHQQDP